jgi:N-acetyl-gamma-glutamyl-phosphate reductase
MKRVGIVGASGYTGAELIRLLLQHPSFEIACLTGHSHAGSIVSEVHTHLPQLNHLTFKTLEEGLPSLNECDLVFVALPHGESMSTVDLLSKVPKIIDLGGDFRLQDADLYSKWYHQEHTSPHQLHTWTYGLPELFRSNIIKANRIANPGCYPTAILLAMAPLLQAGIVDGLITAVCTSGTSGAGRMLKQEFQISHAESNFYAYRLGNHQHTPEIEQTLSRVAKTPIKVSFTPQIMPTTRGMHCVLSVDLKTGTLPSAVRTCLENAYKNEPFISIVDAPPDTKSVRGTNRCLIHCFVDTRIQRVILTSVLDNLVKGAAGQAIQNANLLFGFSETTALPMSGFYP